MKKIIDIFEVIAWLILGALTYRKTAFNIWGAFALKKKLKKHTSVTIYICVNIGYQHRGKLHTSLSSFLFDKYTSEKDRQ